MSTLSPQAQAVLDALNSELQRQTDLCICQEAMIAAAALRVAAEQVVPENLYVCETYRNETIRLNRQAIRRDLLAIAAELEEQ